MFVQNVTTASLAAVVRANAIVTMKKFVQRTPGLVQDCVLRAGTALLVRQVPADAVLIALKI